MSGEELRQYAINEAAKNGVEIYTYKNENGDYCNIYVNINEVFTSIMNDDLKLLPEILVKKFINYSI